LGKDLKENQPDMITKVRSIGMSMGIEINDKNDINSTYKIIFRCYEKGLILVSIAGNVLRVQHPLNIEKDILEKGFNIINEAINDYKNGKISDEVLKYKQTW
jgi:4-aminobutyrate aminotransferase